MRKQTVSPPKTVRPTMYKYEKSVGLVTVASALNQNLALLDADEHLTADSLAVVHEGYVNVIPILNPAARRAKYVALASDDRRGSGQIKEVKWLKMKGETLFVVLSTEGFQVYDGEVADIRFQHACKDRGCDKDYSVGACILKNEYLCIGSSAGTVWIFATNENNSDFRLMDKIYAHDHAVKFLDAYGEYMVSSSHDTIYFWMFERQEFQIFRKVCVPGLLQRPTTLKLSCFHVFVGYDSGEFCIYDLNDEQFYVRNVAHKLEVTAIDFSPLKYRILTASSDANVKVWSYDQEMREVKKLYSLFNEDGPVTGGAFSTMNCSQFCFTTVNNLNVQFYIEEDEEGLKSVAKKNF